MMDDLTKIAAKNRLKVVFRDFFEKLARPDDLMLNFSPVSRPAPSPKPARRSTPKPSTGLSFGDYARGTWDFVKNNPGTVALEAGLMGLTALPIAGQALRVGTAPKSAITAGRYAMHMKKYYDKLNRASKMGDKYVKTVKAQQKVYETSGKVRKGQEATKTVRRKLYGDADKPFKQRMSDASGVVGKTKELAKSTGEFITRPGFVPDPKNMTTVGGTVKELATNAAIGGLEVGGVSYLANDAKRNMQNIQRSAYKVKGVEPPEHLKKPMMSVPKPPPPNMSVPKPKPNMSVAPPPKPKVVPQFGSGGSGGTGRRRSNVQRRNRVVEQY